jgi:hypothetical protein
MFTHLDPDHTEGLRLIEQITLDFRTCRGRPEKQICLLLPQALMDRFHGIATVYGPWLEFMKKSGFVECRVFDETLSLGRQLNAGRMVFVHLEEYWNRSFTDYQAMEKENRRFAYDGMPLAV